MITVFITYRKVETTGEQCTVFCKWFLSNIARFNLTLGRLLLRFVDLITKTDRHTLRFCSYSNVA